MWKYIAACLLFAVLAIWMIFRFGGDLDMGGEKREMPAPIPVETAPKK